MRLIVRPKHSKHYKHHRGPKKTKQNEANKDVDQDLLEQQQFELILKEMNYNRWMNNQNKPKTGIISRACRKIGELINQINKTDELCNMVNPGFHEKVNMINNKFNKDLAIYTMENARRNDSFIKNKNKNGKHYLNERITLDGKNGNYLGLRKMNKFFDVDFTTLGTESMPTQFKKEKSPFEKIRQRTSIFGSLDNNYGKNSFSANFFKKPTSGLMGNHLFTSMLKTRPHTNLFSTRNPLLGISKF